MFRTLFTLLLCVLALAVPVRSANAVEVMGIAKNTTLDGKVLRMTFDRVGMRFHLVYAKSDGSAHRQEMVSRPGESLYDVRHLQPMWKGLATDVGIYGAAFTKAELITPDFQDELSLLFSHSPIEQSTSNTLRGYSFFGVFLQTLWVWAVLIGAVAYAAYRKAWRTLPASLFGGLALAWIIGEAVTLNDHWGHVVHKDRNILVQEAWANVAKISEISQIIGEDDWGRQGHDYAYKIRLNYLLADKPLRPVDAQPRPKIIIIPATHSTGAGNVQ